MTKEGNGILRWGWFGNGHQKKSCVKAQDFFHILKEKKLIASRSQILEELTGRK